MSITLFIDPGVDMLHGLAVCRKKKVISIFSPMFFLYVYSVSSLFSFLASVFIFGPNHYVVVLSLYSSSCRL